VIGTNRGGGAFKVKKCTVLNNCRKQTFSHKLSRFFFFVFQKWINVHPRIIVYQVFIIAFYTGGIILKISIYFWAIYRCSQLMTFFLIYVLLKFFIFM